MRQAVWDLCLTVIPLRSEHAFRFFSMRQCSDPFDRMIVATALAEGIPLIGGIGNSKCTGDFRSSDVSGLRRLLRARFLWTEAISRCRRAPPLKLSFDFFGCADRSF
jgi:hypothetical protein